MSRLAIFWVDPGGSTGVAWGIFDQHADTVIESMSGRTHSGSETIHHGRVEGSNPDQLAEIVRNQVADIDDLWDQFISTTMPEFDRHGDVKFVFGAEHFILTPSPHHKPGFEGIFPAYLLGALMIKEDQEDIALQSASEGMRWNKRPLLTKYGAWIVGKEHERAAFAHIAAYLHRHLR